MKTGVRGFHKVDVFLNAQPNKWETIKSYMAETTGHVCIGMLELL